MLIEIHGKFMYITSDSYSFHGQGHGIKCHFQHLSTGRTIMVHEYQNECFTGHKLYSLL